MLVLGIETSCDDTAAAVLSDGFTVLSSVVSSQDDIHSLYGGVVPELASRRHIECIVPVVDEALKRAGARLTDIDAIAVTKGPGLVGSILIGLNYAKAVAYMADKPLIGVNHLLAHPAAAFLIDEEGAGTARPDFPLVALIVSGGHTMLIHMESFTKYTMLGQTRDDASGEAFDKVAKLMGLGYPGGAEVDRLAKEGRADAINFKRPLLRKDNLEFSFSGIKTAVLTHLLSSGEEPLTDELIRNVSASFQEACVDVLVKKSIIALDKTGARNLVVAGGVACNSRLREKLQEASVTEGFALFIPPPRYCSDNGAMVGALGAILLRSGSADTYDLSLNADPNFLI